MIGVHLEIPRLLVANVPRDLFLAMPEGLEAGARRAFGVAKSTAQGHQASVLGAMRHFHMNEEFSSTLAAAGASPTPLIGNRLVVGHCGIFQVARINVSAANPWPRLRRSEGRRALAIANRQIEAMARPDMFDQAAPITEGLLFFVAYFSGSLALRPEAPLKIEVAIPDKALQSWLFRESIEQVLTHYEPSSPQEDKVKPMLKKGVLKLNDPGDR